MAESLDDGEFWLPPQFLTDDDVVEKRGVVNLSDGDGFSFGGFSDLSSPVESVVGSTETESDEEDFMAGLSLQMARSSVADKSRSVSGSPQSTLRSVVTGGCISGGSVRVSPPPATWDLLYAAAGEVARMRMMNNGIFPVPTRKPSPVKIPNHDAGLYHQRLQAAQFQLLKQQQLQRSLILSRPVKGTGHFQPQPRNTHGAAFAHGGCRAGRHWPSLQQQQNLPSLKPPFPGAPVAAKRGCAGTGVFLPCRNVAGGEIRKKPVLSSYFEPQPHFNDSSFRARSNNQQRLNQEIKLPQEWTY